MKKIFLMFAVCAMSIAASAQTTRVIKGAVIDKNGNPLPGATVNATGGSEVTSVDADGSFSMEVPIWLKSVTAQYAGMKDKKMKIKGEDLIFRMTPKGAKQWFVIANYAHLTGNEYKIDATGHMGGFMGGSLGKWGWYAKFNVGQMENTYSGYHSENVSWNVTAGVTKRIIDPLHVYVGFGTGFVPYKYRTEQGFCPEIGLIGKIKGHYLINATYQPVVSLEARLVHVINVGIGYAF